MLHCTVRHFNTSVERHTAIAIMVLSLNHFSHSEVTEYSLPKLLKALQLTYEQVKHSEFLIIN